MSGRYSVWYITGALSVLDYWNSPGSWWRTGTGSTRWASKFARTGSDHLSRNIPIFSWSCSWLSDLGPGDMNIISFSMYNEWYSLVNASQCHNLFLLLIVWKLILYMFSVRLNIATTQQGFRIWERINKPSLKNRVFRNTLNLWCVWWINICESFFCYYNLVYFAVVCFWIIVT